eukprot:NODE_120_length_18891_cov_0.302682.p12 type:complete len:110 gc:universal NODE_120_length_18891_cov_0.302682:5142-4813(-)
MHKFQLYNSFYLMFSIGIQPTVYAYASPCYFSLPLVHVGALNTPLRSANVPHFLWTLFHFRPSSVIGLKSIFSMLCDIFRFRIFSCNNLEPIEIDEKIFYLVFKLIRPL